MNLINKVLFFIRVTGKNIVPIERSKIDFYHLTIILKGKFTYIVDGKEITLEENDALLLTPGTDRYRLPNPDFADFIIFNFYPAKDNPIASNIHFKNAVNQPIKTLLNAYPYNLYQIIDDKKYNISKCNKLDYSEKNKAKAILHNLFNCILIDLFDSLKYTTKNTHVINTVKYINDNITSPLTLAQVCNAVHLSKEYTARVFKKEMGLTVTQYINQQKLSLAKTMLTGEEFDLQDISEMVGYQNYNYFSRLFKKHFGITPIKMKLELKKEQKTSP